MDPSPLEFVSHTHYYRGGDVVVDASAAIAPGVVLRAAPQGAIRIGPGACIGAGVVIQAKQGCIYIEKGASLGTGVLIVGQGYVGKDACVGPSSTLINPAIAADAIVPSCALIEGESASSAQSSNGAAATNPVPSVPISPRTSPAVQPQSVFPKAVNGPPAQSGYDTGNQNNGQTGYQTGSQTNGSFAITTNNGHVYGRDHLNSLLSALFPHRQPLNNGNSSDQSEKDS